MSEIIIRDERQRQSALDLIAGLNLKKPWRMKLVLFVKTRTNPQLALYWKWLGIIAKETGNDAEDIHDVFKRKFLTPTPIEIGGETHLRFSTGKLPTGDMADYMTMVAAFAGGELGIYLPHPEDQLMEER